MRLASIRVWRIQRDQIYPDVVSCMTHDRKRCAFFRYDQTWEQALLGRSTIYAYAYLASPQGKPRLILVRPATEEEWK